jgi:hypothetical protein
MECPNCKLVNPPNANRCDCGYDFQTHAMEESCLTEADRRLSRKSAGVTGIVLAIVLVVEFMLRLASAAVARHSVALGVVTVLLGAGSFGVWLWLLHGKVSTRRL